jgi:hypothetical protein
MLEEDADTALLPMTETRIVSFVLRFVQPESGDSVTPWHGVVRHVQSREEARFTRVAEALQFMSRYVPLDEGPADGQPDGASSPQDVVS